MEMGDLDRPEELPGGATGAGGGNKLRGGRPVERKHGDHRRVQPERKRQKKPQCDEGCR